MSSPHDLGAAITLADLFSWTGEYDRAVTVYRDVIEQDPLNLAAIKGLARVLRWATRYVEAERCCREVLADIRVHWPPRAGAAVAASVPCPFAQRLPIRWQTRQRQ